MRLLLVEDDAALSQTLARGLREESYAVDIASDGESGLYQASIAPYDVMILDISLPRLDGISLCRKLREQGSAMRILMLTARGSMEDRVAGLDSGADDYLAKPFELEELLARLRAVLRRRGDQVEPAHLQVADLDIDVRARRAARAGVPISLTTKEFTLLAYLARQPDTVLGRAELTEHVWDDNHDPSNNALEVYINRLRKKVDRPGLTPLIHTRRGAGYWLGMAPDARVGT